MKILFLISSMGAGGAERVAATLCNDWAKIGHSVHLIPTYSGGGTTFYPLNTAIKIQYLAEFIGSKNKSLWSYLNRLSALRELIKINQADVVISFLPNVNIASILATRFTGIPVIISERRDPSSQPMTWLWELACRFLYRFSDAVVVQTESVRKSIHMIYPNLKKVTCIPNPLPSDLLVLQSQFNSGSRKILLSLGRLSPEKQVDHIIRCFSKLADECPDWDLHIYGDGPCRDELEVLASSLNASSRIIFKGRSNEPWDVMSKASAFIMTSQFEGFPNALLESMALGLPCVSYDCLSGPRDISHDGDSAFLVPPQNEQQLYFLLSQVLKDKQLRRDLGQRARRSVIDRYQPKVILKQWDALFVDLMLRVDIN